MPTLWIYDMEAPPLNHLMKIDNNIQIKYIKPINLGPKTRLLPPTCSVNWGVECASPVKIEVQLDKPYFIVHLIIDF